MIQQLNTRMADTRQSTGQEWVSLLKMSANLFWGDPKSRRQIPKRLKLYQELYNAMANFWNEITLYLQETEKSPPAFQEGEKGAEICNRLREKLEEIFNSFEYEANYNEFGFLERMQMGISKQLHRSLATRSSYHREIEYQLEKLWDRFLALQKEKPENSSPQQATADELSQNYASAWEKSADAYFSSKRDQEQYTSMGSASPEAIKAAREQLQASETGGSPESKIGFQPEDNLLTGEVLDKIIDRLQKTLPPLVMDSFRKSLNQNSRSTQWMSEGTFPASPVLFPLLMEAEKTRKEQIDSQNGTDHASSGNSTPSPNLREKWQSLMNEKPDFRGLSPSEQAEIVNIAATAEEAGMDVADKLLEEITLQKGLISQKLIVSWLYIFNNRAVKQENAISPMILAMTTSIRFWHKTIPAIMRKPGVFSNAVARSILNERTEMFHMAYFFELIEYMGQWLTHTFESEGGRNSCFIYAGSLNAAYSDFLFDLPNKYLKGVPFVAPQADEKLPWAEMAKDPKVLYYLRKVFDWLPGQEVKGEPVNVQEGMEKIIQLTGKPIVALKNAPGDYSGFLEKELKKEGDFLMIGRYQILNSPWADDFIQRIKNNQGLQQIMYSVGVISLFGRLKWDLDFMKVLLVDQLVKVLESRDAPGLSDAEKAKVIKDFEDRVSDAVNAYVYRFQGDYNPMDLVYTVASLFEEARDWDFFPAESLAGKGGAGSASSAEAGSTQPEITPSAEPLAPNFPEWTPDAEVWNEIDQELVVHILMKKYMLEIVRQSMMDSSPLLKKMYQKSWVDFFPELSRIIRVEYESLIYRYAPGFLSQAGYNPDIEYDMGTFNGVYATFEREIRNIFEQKYRSGK